nr:hypothetical protein [Tanacetum cinerariifolium]
MSLTFADTHNMVAYLNKSDASEGFNQVIDFLNGSYIKYALTVNPNIYVSCIKQFWNTIVVKQTNDVTRLEALVDRKKVVITEAAIRDVLHCLPNEEIFADLARMGYEKPSTKLTFYKAFFSSQWKFLIHTILLVRNVDNTSKFYMYPRFIQLLIRNQLEQVQDDVDDAAAQGADTAVQGDDVHKPSIPSPTPPTPPPQQSQDLPSTSQEVLDACAALTRRVEHLEYDKVAQALEITKLKRRVKKLEKGNRVKGRMIDDLDKDDDVVLMDDKEEEKKEEEAKDDQVQGRQAKIYKIDMDHASKVLSMQEDDPAKVQELVDVVTTAKLITKVVTAASEIVTAASTTIFAAEPQVPAAAITTAALSKDKGIGIMVEESKPMKKKEQVEMDEEYASKLHKELNKDIDWDVAIKLVKQKAKEDPFVQRYPVMKKRPQTKAQARNNMIMYLKNVVGFRLDYFKGMSYEDVRPIFEAKFNLNIAFLLKTKEQLEDEENRAIQSINETPAQKAAKRRKLNEEVEDLKKHLEIVPDEDDDVYTEAIPLVRKVPVVEYEIIHLNNKPHYKIIRADGTHQLYVHKTTTSRRLARVMVEYILHQAEEQDLDQISAAEELINAAGEELSAANQKLMLLD